MVAFSKIASGFALLAQSIHAQAPAAPATAAAPKQQEFSLQLKNWQNVQYFADITIGNQQFPAIYDTGSFEILVLSELCQRCQGYDASKTPLYNNTLSVSYKDDEKLTRAEHVFGSGPVVSLKGYDNVRIGGKETAATAKQLPDTPFWQIEDHQIGAWDSGARFSAIVGLGPKDYVPPLTEVAAKEKKTETLLERADIDKFSICLQREAGAGISLAKKKTFLQENSEEDKKKQLYPPGWLIFNTATPPTKNLVEVVGQVHWGVKMPSFAIGNNVDVCKEQGGCAAIIDSGTSLIAAPASVLNRMTSFFEQIKEDCSNMASLPNMVFTMGTGETQERFELPPAAYVMRITHASNEASIWDWLAGRPRVKVTNSCIPAFMPLDKHSQFGPVFIMGMSFLRYYKTTYVRAKPDTPPKMYFDAVDEGCNAVGMNAAKASSADTVGLSAKNAKKSDWSSKQKALLAEHAESGALGTMWRSGAKSFTPMDVDMDSVVVPKWAKREDFVF